MNENARIAQPPHRDDTDWAALVRQHEGCLRAVARRYRLSPGDVDDVVQNTWMRAWRHHDQLRDPAAISGWLIVTLRREAMRLLQRGVREVLTDAPEDCCGPADERIEDPLLERERRGCLHEAVDRLPDRQRGVVRGLLASPAPSYEELALKLGMPRGSVGPTRDRAIARLREDPELRLALCG